MDIQHKTILITGAASGLGAATARELANRHAKIILCDIHIAAAQEVAADINADAVAFECDVTCEISIKKIIDTLPEIHAVINCAGIVQSARMFKADFSRVIAINLIGTFNMMRLCAEKMSMQNPVNDQGERGVIINTASIAAFEGQLGQVAYSASKGGVVAMTLPAARELSQFGIRVMTIAPGVMHTPMMASLSEEVQKSLAADIPFPKKLGDPKQFAALVAHIIENSYLNGETIRLDGALRLR